MPRLPPLVRDLQIDYTELSLAAPEKVRFRYMLEGHDGGWTEARTPRQAFYSNAKNWSGTTFGRYLPLPGRPAELLEPVLDHVDRDRRTRGIGRPQ